MSFAKPVTPYLASSAAHCPTTDSWAAVRLICKPSKGLEYYTQLRQYCTVYIFT